MHDGTGRAAPLASDPPWGEFCQKRDRQEKPLLSILPRAGRRGALQPVPNMLFFIALCANRATQRETINMAQALLLH
jgi:hypothetical protein